jgi:SAM-dependent methyltransferase
MYGKCSATINRSTTIPGCRVNPLFQRCQGLFCFSDNRSKVLAVKINKGYVAQRLDGGYRVIFNNPIGSEKADRLVRMLPVRAGSSALDAGCGNGEFLLRVVAHHQIDGVGVDQSPRCIGTSRDNAAARGLASRCRFHAGDVKDFIVEPGAFDLGICVGSTHAFGEGERAYPETIERLSEWVRPGGYVLIGEGYWKQPPAADYLKLIGDPPGIYRDHAGNIAFAEDRGLIATYATVSSDDEWDDFEWSYYMQVRREAEANADAEDRAARLARARQWRDGYLRWGRATLGFGMYVFQLPGGAT